MSDKQEKVEEVLHNLRPLWDGDFKRGGGS
jgi:hypothetical protein